MEEARFEDPLEHLESKVLRALNHYDETRMELYDWMCVVAMEEAKFLDHAQPTTERLNCASAAFKELVGELNGRFKPKVAKKMIAEIIIQDDTERVELFSSLLGKECLPYADEVRVKKFIKKSYQNAEDRAELSDSLGELNYMYLSSDLQMLSQAIDEKTNS